MALALNLLASNPSLPLSSGGDCHHHFFKVEFAIFQAILSFTILQNGNWNDWNDMLV